MGFVHRFLLSPQRVLIVCAICGFCSLLFNGSFITLWGMHRDREKISQQIEQIRGQVIDLQSQLKLAKDPSFIEKQAMDRFDLVSENDLVFVFSEASSQ
jgi:cell division protein FtsB